MHLSGHPETSFTVMLARKGTLFVGSEANGGLLALRIPRVVGWSHCYQRVGTRLDGGPQHVGINPPTKQSNRIYGGSYSLANPAGLFMV